MIGFFAKRPALGLTAFVVVLLAGALIAHRRDRRPGAALSLARAGVLKGRVTGSESGWRGKLDLDQAKLEGKQLVQSLPDGTRISYSLDPRLQRWALDYLRAHEVPYAAMTMVDIERARVLVMAGHAADNPKVNTRELCLTPWAPAASVYKLVTASALLDQGVSPEASVCYHGGMHGLNKRHLVDNAKRDQACNSLADGVAKSVNPIMGKLALRHLKPRDLVDWSYRFGFNRSIPFELPVQPSVARIPDGQLEFARVAAGFWRTEASVLHGALIAGVAATRGMLVWPTLVDSVREPNGKSYAPRTLEPERVMSRSLADKLAAMMVNTTTIGTASRSFHDRKGNPMLPGIEVGGKTGSLSRHTPYLHYSWFVGFAPAKKPRVAFAVLLGNPAKWRIKAHTAARVMLGHYFSPESIEKRTPPRGPAIASPDGATKAQPAARRPLKRKAARRAALRALAPRA
jgi:cell division protein FtsI/penicillin-binding protein 2